MAASANRPSAASRVTFHPSGSSTLRASSVSPARIVPITESPRRKRRLSVIAVGGGGARQVAHGDPRPRRRERRRVRHGRADGGRGALRRRWDRSVVATVAVAADADPGGAGPGSGSGGEPAWLLAHAPARRGGEQPGSSHVQLTVLGAPRPVGLAQLELLELAGGGAGQLGAELDRRRALVVGQALAAELDQVGLRGRRPRAQHHERLHRLAPLLVGARR